MQTIITYTVFCLCVLCIGYMTAKDGRRKHSMQDYQMEDIMDLLDRQNEQIRLLSKQTCDLTKELQTIREEKLTKRN